MPTHIPPQAEPTTALWSRVVTALAVERITGPIRANFYIAAYAIESATGYYGYAKVCEGRPDDVWSAAALRKVGTDIDYAQPGEALREAEQLARIAIARGARALHLR
jgi:hypothetical protein